MFDSWWGKGRVGYVRLCSRGKFVLSFISGLGCMLSFTICLCILGHSLDEAWCPPTQPAHLSGKSRLGHWFVSCISVQRLHFLVFCRMEPYAQIPAIWDIALWSFFLRSSIVILKCNSPLISLIFVIVSSELSTPTLVFLCLYEYSSHQCNFL